MPVKTYKPTSPGIRFSSRPSFETLTADEPQKALTRGKTRSGGRNNKGRVTSRFIGGGHKRRYREIDFRRDNHGVPGTIATIEYDPNRSAWIALVNFADGDKRYILAPEGVGVGHVVMAGPDADIIVGNALPLQKIPVGTTVHNIEMKEGKGGQMVRSAGGAAQLMAREGDWALLRLPSGELRRVHVRCYATIGQVGNIEHENVKIGKAGRSRHLGRKPHNRGVSMNPVDHPLGGGEGKTSGGRHPVTPWGKPTKGHKTRNNKKTQKFIVKRRTK
ncbi:MAG TPA: 50S ribosomal protein L2 [Thermoanaerobaculia bacterium]|nr:50S ribosomal protein L2 [Thermoanaerobaculia bacterium]